MIKLGWALGTYIWLLAVAFCGEFYCIVLKTMPIVHKKTPSFD